MALHPFTLNVTIVTTVIVVTNDIMNNHTNRCFNDKKTKRTVSVNLESFKLLIFEEIQGKVYIVYECSL